MEREEDSSPIKKVKLESTDDLQQRRLKRREADELSVKGIEAFVRNNHHDAVEFFEKAMLIQGSLYKDDDLGCVLARSNLHVAMRAQEIADFLPTVNIIKIKGSVAVADPKSLTPEEIASKVNESGEIINPKYSTVAELIKYTDPVGRPMKVAMADLDSTVGCIEMENRRFETARVSYESANYLLESARGDDVMFSDVIDLINSIVDELGVIVSPENKDKPVEIDNLCLKAKNLEDKFTALYSFLSAQPQDAGEQQVQGT